MAKKIELKTTKNSSSVTDYINSIPNETGRQDCETLLNLFKETTGMEPMMWGDTIVGFGEYTYHRSNGDEGEYLATGFSFRKSGPTLYIMPGYGDFSEQLSRLGPHKLGKSCLYLKNLKGIDLGVLSELVAMGLEDLKKNYKTNY